MLPTEASVERWKVSLSDWCHQGIWPQLRATAHRIGNYLKQKLLFRNFLETRKYLTRLIVTLAYAENGGSLGIENRAKGTLIKMMTKHHRYIFIKNLHESGVNTFYAPVNGQRESSTFDTKKICSNLRRVQELQFCTNALLSQ